MPQTARQLLTSAFAEIDADSPISELLRYRREGIRYSCLSERGTVRGVIRMDRAFPFEAATCGNLLDETPPPAVSPDAQLEEVVRLLVQTSEDGLPVVDDEGHLLGVVGAESILRTLVAETPGVPRRLPDLRQFKTAVAEAFHRMAMIAEEDTSLEDALQQCIDLICELIGWPVGHAYLVDEEQADRLLPRDIWYLSDATAFEPFRRATEDTTLRIGQCLPGQVLQQRGTVWIPNIQHDPTFIRGDNAVDCVKGGFGFPIQVGGRIVAVLEFFAENERALDEDVLRLVDSLGRQVGRVVERNQAWTAVRTSEIKYRNLFDAAPVSICLIGLDGVILDCNAATETLTGFSRDHIIGRYFWELEIIPPEELVRYRRLFHSVLNGASPGVVEMRFRDATGTIRWCERSAALLKCGDQPFGIQVFSRDITERKRAEAHWMNHQAELAHTFRLNVMGEMASQLAHELNQPLQAIELYSAAAARMAEAGSPPPGELAGTLQKVMDQSHRAGEIIRRLRDFVRRREPRRSSVDVNHVLREVRAFIELEAHLNEIEIRMDLQESLPPVCADPVQIEQVFLNLARNALEAMQEVPVAKRQLEVQTRLADENAVLVTVRDHGPGVSAEMMSRLFEPFFTTKSFGMGMGLPISKSIVEAHDGALWSEPTPGGGLTLHCQLFCSARPDE